MSFPQMTRFDILGVCLSYEYEHCVHRSPIKVYLSDPSLNAIWDVILHARLSAMILERIPALGQPSQAEPLMGSFTPSFPQVFSFSVGTHTINEEKSLFRYLCCVHGWISRSNQSESYPPDS